MELIKFIIRLLCLQCLFCCTNIEQHRKETSKIGDITTDEQIWKTDSCGCLKKRNAEMAERIILRYNLIGKDTLVFIEHMGHCNKRSENYEKIIYTYFLEAQCLNNSKIDFYADKAWINFEFDKSGRLMRFPEEICVE